MPANLLLLPLLAGFCFTHLLHSTRFRIQLEDGNRLLLASSIAGVILLATSRLVVIILKQFACGLTVRHAWFAFAPQEMAYLGTASGALILGCLVPILVNCAFLSEAQAKDRALSRDFSLAGFFHSAARNGNLVSITLSNRKWYVGYIVDAPTKGTKPGSFFGLLPVLSGYRDKDDLTTKRTTSYLDALESTKDPSVYTIIIPMSEVTTANRFLVEAYRDHFATPQPPPVDHVQDTAPDAVDGTGS